MEQEKKKLTEAIQEVLEAGELTRASNEGFVELRDFFLRMKASGLVIQTPYSLPLIDTIGSKVFERSSMRSPQLDSLESRPSQFAPRSRQ